MTLESYSKNFPNDIDVYLSSDNISTKERSFFEKKFGVKILEYPENISWSASLRFIINNKPITNYRSIIFTFDDLVLTKKIARNKMHDAVKFILNEGADYLVLNDRHRTIYSDVVNLFSKSSTFKLNSNDSYRGSLVFSVWKYTFLQEIINDKFFDDLNPWEYEQHINYKLGNCKSFSFNTGLFHFVNVIVKGKVLYSKKIKAEAKTNTKYQHNREYISGTQEIIFNAYSSIFKVLRYLLPPLIFKTIREIKNQKR